MHRLRRSKPSIWVAVLATWLAALLPTLSYALAHHQGVDAVQVCTAFGVQTLDLRSGEPVESVDGAAGRDDGSAWKDLFQHCGWCLVGGQALTGPPSTALAPTPTALRHARPWRSVGSDRPAPAWSTQPSRAPPVAG